MKRPFVFLSTSLTLGILVGYFLKIEISFFIVSLFIFLLVYIFIGDKNLRNSLLVVFIVFILGLGIFKVNSIETIENYIGEDVKINGYIYHIDKKEDDYVRYILKGTNISYKDRNYSITDKILLTSDKLDLEIGEKLEITTVLKLPSKNTNPLLFNYRNYLRAKDIRVTAYSDKDNILIKGMEENKLLSLKKTVLFRIENSLDQLAEKNRSFIMSMLLGDSSFMEIEDLEAFRELGLAHILAVSGLHLGIITSFLIGLLSLFTIDRKLINILSILFIFFYTYIIGFPPSILRAGIMLSIYLISININRYSDSINNLFFVSFILALLNPYIIFSVGFQLSFVATLSVLIIPKSIRLYYRKTDSKLVDSLTNIVGVQLGILPLQVYYFNNINILGVISNLLIVPLISFILPLTFLLFILPLKFGVLKYSISYMVNILMNIVFYIKDGLMNIGIGGFRLASPSLLGIFFYYLILLIIIKKIRIDIYPKDVNKSLIIFLLFILCLNVFNFNIDKGLAIEFIDVDQGDSSLVRYRDKSYLIDTGGNAFKKFDIGKNILIPYLEKSGVKKLDAVFISHFDADHCKSLVDLMDEIDIDRIFIGYKREENQYYRDIVRRSRELDIPISILSKGDVLNLGENFNIRVLGPDRDFDESLSDNDLSLVFKIEYMDYKILFTGDIEAVGESKLVSDGVARSDFLKSPHHGSKTSSSLEFLEETRAGEVFIQVGRNNSFSHPNEEILGRYKDMGMNIYRTDEDGMIKLFINQKTYAISKFIQEKYSIMNVIVNYKYIIIYSILYILSLLFLVKSYIGNKELDSFELW